VVFGRGSAGIKEGFLMRERRGRLDWTNELTWQRAESDETSGRGLSLGGLGNGLRTRQSKGTMGDDSDPKSVHSSWIPRACTSGRRIERDGPSVILSFRLGA